MISSTLYPPVSEGGSGGIGLPEIQQLIDQAGEEDRDQGRHGLTETHSVVAAGSHALELVGAGPEVNLAFLHFVDFAPTATASLYMQLVDDQGNAVFGYRGYYGPNPRSLQDFVSINEDGMLLAPQIAARELMSGRVAISRGSGGFHVFSTIFEPGRATDQSIYLTLNTTDISGVRLYWSDNETFGDGFASFSWSK